MASFDESKDSMSTSIKISSLFGEVDGSILRLAFCLNHVLLMITCLTMFYDLLTLQTLEENINMTPNYSLNVLNS